MSTIASGSEQQRARIGEVHAAMSAMDGTTQQNAALVEEAAAAAESLESEAGELLRTIDRFVVASEVDGDTAALRPAA